MSKLRGLAISCWCATLSAACGGAQAAPRPTEVPVDNSSSSTASPTTSTSDDTNAAPPDADPSSLASALSDSTPPPSSDTPAPAADSTGSKPPGGALSKSECQKLSDKGVDLLIAGMGGIDPSMASQIKAQAASNPNFSGMQSECLKSTTRAQYKCGMNAKSKDEWEKCLK